MVTRNRKGTPKPTWVSLVFNALVQADDFVNFEQLMSIVKPPTRNVLHAALAHLRAYKAIDSLESGGRLWWFASPENDTRARKVLERIPEDGKRAVRKGRRSLPRVIREDNGTIHVVRNPGGPV